ncbi:hypothetical protein FRC04_002359 [Tulasnella sp. 424]|nr:hypothetical protein FRC04_002359 [Tulasnella sp. 424]
MAQKYIVKSCLSGDTLVLRSRPAPGQPPKERIAHIAEVTAPRLGSSQRDDEPFAFESREYLRALTVGKEITFESTYSVPANDGVPRDVGIVTLNGQDLTIELLKNGWAKLKENKREATDEDIQRRAIEADAKTNSRGIWNAAGIVHRSVYHTMPTNTQEFMTQWKGKPINSIVETAKAFVELRLLQRPVTVTLLSVPPPPAAAFGSLASDSGAPAAATTFIGTCIHAQGGNIAEPLAAAGLAKVLEWHAGMLSSYGGLEALRAAEKSAKEKRLKLHSTTAQPSTGPQKPGAPAGPSQRTEFEGQVIRIWSGDQISVWDDAAGKDRRLQLSSVRGPRANDPKQAGYAAEAKEFLRKKLIGKTVTVKIDFVRPPEGEYESRDCATITLPGQKTSVAEQLIERGLATAVRHRRDDENRSPDYDKLIAAEQAAASGTKGLHSGKDVAIPRIVNVSETHSKASQFLPSYKRSGKIPAIVDYVAAGSRFKLLLSRDNQSITFVLSGIRAPRTARNPSEKAEPCGEESSQFSTRRYLQRDVEVHIEAVDKTGGFIGTLYLTKPDKTVENAAVALTQEGLAFVHHHSAENLPWSRQLFDAEESAKAAKRGVWKHYVEEAEVEVVEQDAGALKTQYIDVIVSDVRTAPQFGFSVQILNNEGIANLEKLMREFSLHHRAAIKAPPSFSPKPGDLVSARFSADNSWYRAKIRKIVGKTEYDVVFIDYGNQETVSLTNIRPLDDKFRALAGQAQDARLSFVKLSDVSSDYFDDAIERFRSICEGRKLIANIDAREGPVLHLRLIDPEDAGSPTNSINAQLVREGLAIIDRKGCKYLSSYPQIFKRLQEDAAEAKRSRSGMYEFGDISPEDD